MKEGEKSPAQLHIERQCFVQKAIEESAHEAISEKTVNIGVAATFGHSPLEEIGQSYGQTRANASLLYRGFITELWNNSSEQTRSFHALEDLLARKPIPQESRERISENQGGGRTSRIRNLILAGAKSVGELEKRSGLSRENIWNTLRTLDRWGVDVSQFSGAIRKNREKIQQLIKETDGKKIQEIMDELSDGTIRANMGTKKGNMGNPRVFTTIGKAKSGVYYYKGTETHLFTQDLEDNRIPNRRVSVVNGGKLSVYHVFLEKHKERALAAWKKDPRLERLKVPHPVTVLCGNKNIAVPTAYQLMGGKDYRSVSSVLRDLGIKIYTKQEIEFRKIFFKDCPITIFAYRKSRYISASDIEQFKQYFLEKHAQIIPRFLQKEL